MAGTIHHNERVLFAEPRMRAFQPLPNLENHEGRPRRVGVELEMAGLKAADLAAAVTATVGGCFEPESAFSGTVHDTELGDFRIELDASVLTERRHLELLDRLGFSLDEGEMRDNFEAALSKLAGLVVPHELVCPPVVLDALPQIDRIRARLHQAGARGTGASPLYAFGLQFNIEIDCRDPAALLAMLRAFLLRFDDIVAREQVDFSRKLTPYVQPFPEDYVAYLLDPDYAPDLERLMDDYLVYTPTRNRPLDLLPLFAWLDEARVMAAPIESELVKSRPTWHYRLPNCRIDDPDWSLHAAWDEWAEVERLAGDPERLRRQAAQRLEGSSAWRRWLAATWRRLGAGWSRD